MSVKSQESRSLRPSSLAKRQAIMSAAEDAFLAARYDSVTMDEIAEASQVSKQTVYAYFGTKDRLFVDLVTAMTRQAADLVSAEATAPESRDQVPATLENLLGRQLRAVLSPRMLRLRRLVISEVPRFPDLARAVFEQGPHRAVTTLEALLVEFDARGWIRTPDPARAADQLNWLVMGAPTNAAMFLGDEVAPTLDEQQAHVRAAVTAFMAAYAPRP
jgi:TetR/AcrR family transcriptional regulator, mexJK operon transcriptional repressor